MEQSSGRHNEQKPVSSDGRVPQNRRNTPHGVPIPPISASYGRQPVRNAPDNRRRQAPAGQPGQRPPQNGTPAGRAQPPLRHRPPAPPSRPDFSRGGHTAPANKNPSLSPNIKRNLILAAMLSVLVTVCIIIFAVQSCAKKDSRESGGNVRDTVQLNTQDKPDDSGDTAAAFAKYSDSSAQLSVKSEYGILIDLDKNQVIASKNAEEKIYPASMTKIMTLIVAYENIDNFDDTFTFTSEILDPLYGENASVAGFSPGETVPLKDIIYGCILPSGADCTAALAQYVAGSEAAFADMMNEKAASLGLKNTHFVTASGLHDNNHYSTCHEMAIILRYAIRNEYMRSVLSTYKYTTTPTEAHPDGITLVSTLFSRMDGGEAEGVYVQGGKTGYTLEAKNCLATFAANCTEEQSPLVQPQYLLVTAYASGEYTPVFDAIDVYSEYCSGR